MAYTQSNVVKTRIQLKHDTYESWTRNNPVLLPGEIAVATLAPFTNEVNPAGANANQHPVLFKVGQKKSETENYKFNELPWASALAADVYAWAKQTENDFVNTFLTLKMTDGTTMESKLDAVFVNNTELANAISGLKNELNIANYYTKNEVDTKFNAALDAASAVLGSENDGSSDTTVYGAFAAIAEANDAIGDVEDALNTHIQQADVAFGERYTKTEVDGLIAPLATKEALNGVKATAEAAATKTYTDNQLALKADKTALAETDEEVAYIKGRVEAFLDNTGAATEAIDTLQELLNYIKTHDDVEINAILADIQKLIDRLDGLGENQGDVKKYIDAVITRVQALESKPFETYATKNEVTELKEYTDEQLGAAEDAANEYTDAEIAKLGDLAHKDVIVEGDISGTIAATKITNFATEVAAVKVANATNADQLGGKAASDYALALNNVNASNFDSYFGETLDTHYDNTTATVATENADGTTTIATGVYLSVDSLDYKISVEKTGAVTFAKVAKTGNIADLTQTTNTYVLFDCGSATDVI